MDIKIPDWIPTAVVGTLGLVLVFAVLKWAFGLGWEFGLSLGM
jgi:hypothetical protein